MLNGDDNEPTAKKLSGPISKNKKQVCTSQHTFLYISLPLLLRRQTSKSQVLGRKCLCADKKFVACVPVRFFHFTAAHFHLEGR